MSVVSDTTAITTLLKAERDRLLEDMFGHVFVPQAVWDELAEFHRRLPAFIELRRVGDASQRLPGTELLGRGEAEALSLALELKAQLLLTDDRRARIAAQRLGIPCSGLVGVVVRAKQLGKVPSVRDLLDSIQAKGGLYLSDAVVTEALRMANEL
jgi:predicted nucleic acid-binding protein